MGINVSIMAFELLAIILTAGLQHQVVTPCTYKTHQLSQPGEIVS